MPLPSFKQGFYGKDDVALAVKLNFKWGQLSLILLYDAAFCQKWTLFVQFSFYRKIHGHCIFLAKGFVVEQNKRKLTPVKIHYCQSIISLPNPFSIF